MALNWAPSQGATNCTGSVTPGARALYAWGIEAYPSTSTFGIYNCRTVRGGSTTSLHGEGRAWDQKIPFLNGRANPLGHDIIHRVGVFGRRLGVQRAIFDRTIYDASPEDINGGYYGGAHPHDDHIHWELTWNAASNLTLATLRHVLGTRSPAMFDSLIGLNDSAGGPDAPSREREQVKFLQRALITLWKRRDPNSDPLPQFKDDGDWGDETSEWLGKTLRRDDKPVRAATAWSMELLMDKYVQAVAGPRDSDGGLSKAEVRSIVQSMLGELPDPNGLTEDVADGIYVRKFGQGGSGSELPEHRHGLRNSTGHVVRES